MGKGSADIRSPETLQRFRFRYLEFDKNAHSALELIYGDLRSIGEWLNREQLPYWKRQLRIRHDRLKEAWREYINARYGDRRMGKPSCVDERKAYEKAKRMKEEAEFKIRMVERWQIALDQQIEKLVPPCRRFGSMLDELTPKAVARLEHMMDRLEDYLRPSSGRPSARAPAGGKEGGDASDQPS